MLRLENLTKNFGPFTAVEDLTFHLEPGWVCGFVGPNGAGKTTTMRIIATLDEPTKGEVFVNGKSIFEDPYAVRRRIGFMPDHYGAYPAMNCEDYLQFYARAYEVPGDVREKRVRGVMDFTGIDKIQQKDVESLSKGMRQRLNLARALINDPDLLILDEPAAGLDPRARIEFRFLVRSLADRGKTIFISSHILTELAEICDSMLIIDKGKMVTFGSFEDIQKAQGENLELTIRLLDKEKCEALERFLIERQGIIEANVGERGAVRVLGNIEDDDVPALLRAILDAGFPVIEFSRKALTMEDVFLKITDGDT